jgi:radical SAM/Cys-rich protein
MKSFKNAIEVNSIKLGREAIKTLQVNMGNLCNQSCMHCHIGASPDGKKIMSKDIVDDILTFLKENKGLILDITGGAPELNPEFDYLVQGARSLVKEIIVRSNLTVIFEPNKEYLPEFFKENKIHIVSSLPCYTEPNVDTQRGKGVFVH